MIELIIFILVVIILFFLIKNIRVIHIDTLPYKDKLELKKKYSIKSDSDYVQSSNNISNKSKILSTDYLISLVKSNNINYNYQFNLANLPVTTRYPSTLVDKKCIEFIKSDIDGWNQLFSQNSNTKYRVLSVVEIYPFLMMETENEFIIIVVAKILYFQKMLYFRLKYYGKIELSDDFTNHDLYHMQLISIFPISKLEYERINKISEKNFYPFITMEEQMSYVNKIKKMHENEINEY